MLMNSLVMEILKDIDQCLSQEEYNGMAKEVYDRKIWSRSAN